MAQRKSDEDDNVNEVLKLVDRLSPAQRQELYRRLDLKSWGERWRALCSKVDEQNKHLPPLTEEEILSEMMAIREELKEERASGSN